MIPIHLCSTGQRFKHTFYEKHFKPSKKKARKEASVDITNWMTNRYIHCATDINQNKHVYIKTVKFLNKHCHILLEVVYNICMYHIRATLNAQ